MRKLEYFHLAMFACYVVTAGAFCANCYTATETDRLHDRALRAHMEKLSDLEFRLMKAEKVHVPTGNAWGPPPSFKVVELSKLQIQIDALESKHADLCDYYRKLVERVDRLEPKKQTRTVRPPELLPAIDPEFLERIPPVFPPLPIPEK